MKLENRKIQKPNLKTQWMNLNTNQIKLKRELHKLKINQTIQNVAQGNKKMEKIEKIK